MSFLWPRMLWFLFLVPALAAAYVLSQRRRRKYALRFASLSVVKEALGAGPGFRRHVPPILFISAVAVLAVALARPTTTVILPTQRATVILALDVSGSMRAQDVSPSRIEAAQAAARAFVEKQPKTQRIGVVTFAESSSVVQAPTTQHEAVLAAIDRLRTYRGTAIGAGILTSMDAIMEENGKPPITPQGSYGFGSNGSGNGTSSGGRGGLGGLGTRDRGSAGSQQDSQGLGGDQGLGGGAGFGGFGRGMSVPLDQIQPAQEGESYPNAVIVLLSDGQSNTGPDPLEVVDRVSDRGVKIFTIGLGTPEGTVLGVFGRSMRVRLDEDTLKSIANKTGGAYFRATSDTDLRAIYANLGTKLVMETQKTEITAILAALAALLLLGTGALSLAWFNRLP